MTAEEAFVDTNFDVQCPHCQMWMGQTTIHGEQKICENPDCKKPFKLPKGYVYFEKDYVHASVEKIV